MASIAERVTAARASAASEHVNPAAMQELRGRLHFSVVEELGPTLYDQKLTPDELHSLVYDSLSKALDAEVNVRLGRGERAALLDEIVSDVLGYGPIDPYLRNPEVTEVMVNGPDLVFIERGGRIEAVNSRFVDERHVRRIIDKIVFEVGRRIDEATPMVDARLPDGSRVNAIIAPLAIGGPFLTIRKFSADPYTIDDLLRFGTLTPQAAQVLRAAVLGRLNIVVSGGTGSGKTTLLNVISSFIPDNERIITIEDAAELQLAQRHVLTLESRPPNLEGKGEVTIRDLVRNALRMRPDRIIVGEARGGEALDMLQAMNTGHDGSVTTIHSNTPRDTISRIETMVLMSGFELPLRAIREQVSSAIDLIVHIARLRDGTRRVTHITEVEGMEGDVITLQDLFLFDFGMGTNEDGVSRGRLKSTGLRPGFTTRLANQNIRLGADLFEPEPMARQQDRRTVW